VDIKEYISSGIIESYVLGLTSAEEAEEFERICAAHSEVRVARDLFEQQLEQNAIAVGVQPPRKLRSLVLSEIEIDVQKFGASPIVGAEPPMEEPRQIFIGPRIWKYAAAACVILLAASAILNFYFFSEYRRYSSQYSQLVDSQSVMARNQDAMKLKADNYAAAMKMMHDTNMAMIKMQGVHQHQDNSATVFWDKRTKNVYLMPDNLPEPPQGMQYQLWAIVDGKPIDAGLLNWATGNMTTPMKTIPTAEAFAITLEKAGGSDSPSDDAMYVMGNT
jgi:anti-sigma-K factor RskA